MTEKSSPVGDITDEALQALLRRAMRNTLILGLVLSGILLLASGWRNAAMLAVGAAISAASIVEWQRLIRFFNARLDEKKAPRGTATVITFFMLRLAIFAGAIYGSLRGFQGSAIALLCGLGLAMIAMAWEALRLLKS
jgi:hypothetical protein